MLKQGLEKLQEIIRKSEEARTYEINGETYYPRKLELKRIEAPIKDSPQRVDIDNLTGLVKVIKSELEENDSNKNTPLYVKIGSPREVTVFTKCKDDDKNLRYVLYIANCMHLLPRIDFGEFVSNEDMIISLRSKFKHTDDLEYVLKTISKISEKSTVEATDNGLCQEVQIKKGMALVENTIVKPIVNLKPYRTFFSVEQPASDFLLRFKEGGQVALFEADGGMWKKDAREYIAKELEKQLKELIETDLVVILA